MVYRARHVLLDAEVAIRVLLGLQDQDAQYRFLQEAQLASKVKHPNTVVVSDFGVLPDDRSYLAMEFRGPTLSKVISQGPLRRCGCADRRPDRIGLKPSTTRGIIIEISNRIYFESAEKFANTSLLPRESWK